MFLRNRTLGFQFKSQVETRMSKKKTIAQNPILKYLHVYIIKLQIREYFVDLFATSFKPCTVFCTKFSAETDFNDKICKQIGVIS